MKEKQTQISEIDIMFLSNQKLREMWEVKRHLSRYGVSFTH